jgi:hypothetical protein
VRDYICVTFIYENGDIGRSETSLFVWLSYGKRYVLTWCAKRNLRTAHNTSQLSETEQSWLYHNNHAFFKREKKSGTIPTTSTIKRFREYFRWFDKVFWGGGWVRVFLFVTRAQSSPRCQVTCQLRQTANITTAPPRQAVKTLKFEESYKNSLATCPGQSEDNLDILGVTVLSGMCVWS